MTKQSLLIALLSLFIALQGKATGQSGDIIYIQGKSWELLNKPIWTDTTLDKRLRAFLPKDRSVSTANWDGYTAFWEIRNDSLFLLGISVDMGMDSELKLSKRQLKKIFKTYYVKDKIHASWYNGTLRAAQGELVRYVHSGFNRNLETEQIMTLKQGKVLQSETYHNYKKPGFYFDNVRHEISKRFPWEQFPEYKGRKLIFQLKDLQVTEEGRFVDCNVQFFGAKPRQEKTKNNNPEIEEAFKETLKAIYPWEVLYIYNKYTTQGFTYMLPIQETTSPAKSSLDHNHATQASE